MFNVVGVVLWLPFIGLLARLALAVSPAGAGLEGTAVWRPRCRARLPMPTRCSTSEHRPPDRVHRLVRAPQHLVHSRSPSGAGWSNPSSLTQRRSPCPPWPWSRRDRNWAGSAISWVPCWINFGMRREPGATGRWPTLLRHRNEARDAGGHRAGLPRAHPTGGLDRGGRPDPAGADDRRPFTSMSLADLMADDLAKHRPGHPEPTRAAWQA